MDERSWGDAQRSADGLIAGGASLAARLDAWLADARVDDSADARARERWLRSAAEADATFVGVLLDLAERGAAVAVSTVAGRRHHGHIRVLGADFVALRLPTGSEVLVALATVAAVRTAPLADAAMGERVVSTELQLIEVLGELATDRARVLVVPTDAGEAFVGELRSAGRNVVTVRTDGAPPVTAYVPVHSITEVALV